MLCKKYDCHLTGCSGRPDTGGGAALPQAPHRPPQVRGEEHRWKFQDLVLSVALAYHDPGPVVQVLVLLQRRPVVPLPAGV